MNDQQVPEETTQPKFGQSEYWDRVADKKTFSHEIDWDFLGPRLDSQATILDYGCGYGRLTRDISERGFKNLIGVDFSIGMIERAKRESPHLHFKHHNQGTLEFADHHFDLVLVFAVLTCIPLDHDQSRLVRDLKRVLKPGGLLYISDVLIASDARNMSRYESSTYEPFGTFGLEEGVVLRHHRLEYLTQVLLSEFDVLYERELEFVSMNGNASKAVQVVGRKR